MALGNSTGEKETRCRRRYSICFSTQMMYSLQTSVAVSSPSSSRTGSSQCHGQSLLCCFGGCCLAMPMALRCKNSRVAKQRPWQHRSTPAMLQRICVCPSPGEQCRQRCSSTPSPAAAPLGGGGSRQRCQQGHVHKPSAAWRAPPSHGRVRVSSRLPLGSVPASDSAFVDSCGASQSISGEI